MIAHIVVLYDVIKMLLVYLPIINGEGDTLGTEPASSSDPMKVDLWIGYRLVVELYHWHVIVDDKLCLRHIDTSSNHIGCNQHVNVLVSELLNGVVTLLL